MIIYHLGDFGAEDVALVIHDPAMILVVSGEYTHSDRAAVEKAMAESDSLPSQVTAVMALPDFPVGPVDVARIQRTAAAMLQFGLLGRQYTAEVQQETLVRSMVTPGS